MRTIPKDTALSEQGRGTAWTRHASCESAVTVAGEQEQIVRSVVIKCDAFLASLLLVVANIPFSVLFSKTSSPDNMTHYRKP